MSVILILLRQKDCEFEASLDCIDRSCLKNQTSPKRSLKSKTLYEELFSQEDVIRGVLHFLLSSAIVSVT